MPKGVDRPKKPTGKTHYAVVTIAPRVGLAVKAMRWEPDTREYIAALESQVKKKETLEQGMKSLLENAGILPDRDTPQAIQTAPAAFKRATDADIDRCIREIAAASPNGKTSRNDLRKKAPGWYRDNGIIFDKEPDWSDLLDAYPELRRGSGRVKRA